MSFELRVEFSGLCLYLPTPRGDQAAILMPDGRRRSADLMHADDEPAEPHVGYLRFNLANLNSAAEGIDPRLTPNEPPYEVIHRFGRHVLDFGLDDPQPMDIRLPLPDFREFAPSLVLKPGLFGEAPDPTLLLRTIIAGGSLGAQEGNRNWRIPNTLNPGGQEVSGQFAGSIMWTRTVDQDSLNLRIHSFDGFKEVVIPLHPTPDADGQAVILLKVANLCAYNPLEWEDMNPQDASGPDKDFRWLYRLVEPREGGELGDVLKGAPLPVPHPAEDEPSPAGREHCIGGRITGAFQGI